MPQPHELTVSEAAREIKSKKLSPVELAESLLERIEATDDALKAWITIDREEVLTNAKQREEEAGRGDTRGPSWCPCWSERHLLHRRYEDGGWV